jgi:hypothetical protein
MWLEKTHRRFHPHRRLIRMTRCLTLAAALLLAGCVRVRAHERGYLAQPTMNPQAAPLEQKLDTHVHEYREGSMGGNGVGGGGCGCN